MAPTEGIASDANGHQFTNGHPLDISNPETLATAIPQSPYSEHDVEHHSPSAGYDSEAPLTILSDNDIDASLTDDIVEDDDERMHLMYRFTLYETSTRFFLVGQDITERHFRILKIDRTVAPGQLGIFEDENVYDKRSIQELIATIGDGNKASGGLKLKCNAWGLLGFVKFTEAYYMLLVTKRTQAAMIGGHYIYQVEDTTLVPLTTGSTSRFSRDRNAEESRFLSIFANVDLTKSFYYSYSYNITRTLQSNIITARQAVKDGRRYLPRDWNDMFMWNYHLLEPAMETMKHIYDWCIPIVHGYVDQAALNVFGRRVYITIIARRSRHFAGARYLKRGSNDNGYVANDVETEQVVSDVVTTSFHAPGPKLFSNPSYTSYVQHRGSIPLFWSQDNSGVTPKPDIDLNLIDPFYSAAALHFDNLFERYGAPVYVLNLIKSRERTPRETKLLHEYQKSLAFLNQSLPEDKKILYRAFDMSRAAKTRGQDVIGVLEIIAEDIMKQTGFFHNGDSGTTSLRIQNGVARTNCIDCLDRTNAAQFVIGKRALGHQLRALGVISGEVVEYDTDAVNTFTHMFHAHGDTIAIQYGGSHLAHTMATYRKINEWKNHSRDVVESFKRYYHNSFLDSQRQEAFNLFLGNYIYEQGQPLLWDLASDYYLHHADPRDWLYQKHRDYINWYTPEFLEPRKMPDHVQKPSHKASNATADEYWLEYYKPLAITSFAKTFAYKMDIRPRFTTEVSAHTHAIDPSPFVPRKIVETETTHQANSGQRKSRVMIVEPTETNEKYKDVDIGHYRTQQLESRDTLDSQSNEPLNTSSNMFPADRVQWSVTQWYENLKDPTVTEVDEYIKYVEYPHKLLLVTGMEPVDASSYADYTAYLARGEPPEFAVSRTPVAHDVGVYQLYNEDDDKLFGDMDPEDLADYSEYLEKMQTKDPLTVTDDDAGKKRYKAYRQWLKGKSFFKLNKLDPEYRAELV